MSSRSNSPRNALTNTSFIQTSSASCCSPYAFRVAAGSRRIGNSRRIRVESTEKPEKSRPRSRSSWPACCATVTSPERPPSVRGVPSLEVIAELFLPAIEVPPGARVLVGQVREDLEVLDRLRADVLHLPLERLLAERILPDRAPREEAGCPALAGELDEASEDREVGAGAEDDPRHFRRAAQPLAVLPEFSRVRRGLRIPGELGFQHVDSERAEGLGGADDRVGLVVRELRVALPDRIGHRLADECEVEPAALVGHGPDDLDLVVHDLARGVRVEEHEELRGARTEPFHLLHAPAVEERRQPPVPLLLIPGCLQGDEEALATGEDEPVDRGPDPVLRIEKIAARVGREGVRDAELDPFHFRVCRGFRVFRMEHLLEAPPLVHRDHRESARIVRNLLEAPELTDRNPHSFHRRNHERTEEY